MCSRFRLFVLKISKLSIFELGSGRISDNVKYAKSQEKKLVIIWSINKYFKLSKNNMPIIAHVMKFVGLVIERT